MKARRRLVINLFRGSVPLWVLFSFLIATASVYGKDTDRGGAEQQVMAAVDRKPLTLKNDPFGTNWDNLGLYGGYISAIVFDPSDPDIIFAASHGGDGLFMSMKVLNNWLPVFTGQEGGELEGEATFRNTAVWSLKFAPSDPETVWAVHDIWAEKGTGGGFVWTHIDNRRMQEDCANCGGVKDAKRVCRSLAIDPTTTKRVYIGTAGPFGSKDRGAIYITDDGGDTWTKSGYDASNEFGGTVVDIAVHPKDPSFVWTIASADPDDDPTGRLYISRDYGKKWDPLFKDDVLFYDLEIWPQDPNIVFVATANGIVSNISGRYEYMKDLAGVRIRSLAFDPQNPYLLYTSGSKGIGIGTYYPDKKVFVFEKMYDVGLEFNTLAVHPETRHLLFGGDSKGGVFKASYDRDSDKFRVSAHNNGINALRVHDIDLLSADDSRFDHLIAATASGVQIRVGPKKWKSVSPSGPPNTEASAVAFVPPNPNPAVFYAGGQGYLALTTDGGKTWKINNQNIPDDMHVSDIAVAEDGATLFLTTRRTRGGGGFVYKSTDGGASLKKVISGYNFDFNTVSIDPNNPQHILAGSGNFYGIKQTGRLYQSIDGGESWKATGLRDVVINSLLFDPETPETIYAGCGNYSGAAIPLFKSLDGGITWKPSYDGIPGRPVRYGVWGSSPDDVFFLGHTGSVVKGGSDDRRIMHFDGSTWSDKMDSGVLEHLTGIWGSAPDDVFAMGDKGAIVRYDGSRWSAMEPAEKRSTSRDLNAVWGASGSKVYAVGDSGTILHFNGRRWTAQAGHADVNLYDVWGDAQCNHIYAVGDAGTILLYCNGRWMRMSPITKVPLNGIWGTTCGEDIYTVGAPSVDHENVIRYTILKFDGEKWSRMDAPAVAPGKGNLNGVWGASGTDVFAVGDDGVILHYDGKTWTETADRTRTQMALRATADLYGIYGFSEKQAYAVGRYGTILYYDGADWKKVDSASIGSPVERITQLNAVTGLQSQKDRGGSRNLYAGTERQGIYFSSNQGTNWINLSSPPYPVFALAVGSAAAAAYGVYNYQGSGFIAGVIADDRTKVPLPNSYAETDLFTSIPTGVPGGYFLGVPAGTYNVTGISVGYHHKTIPGVESTHNGTGLDIFLTEPNVKVSIDGAEVSAVNGIFEGSHGDVRPIGGLYEWSGAGNAGHLKVLASSGWVTLRIAPDLGFKIGSVTWDGGGRDPVAEHTITNLLNTVETYIFDVQFAAVIAACPADYDSDHDVDGSDLTAFTGGVIGVALSDLAVKFGQINCTQP
jgi:photosystem II stability/assembly factor-like uncharacterized protein